MSAATEIKMSVDQIATALPSIENELEFPEHDAEIESEIRFQKLKVGLHEQLLDAIQLSSLQGAEQSKREEILQRAILTLVTRRASHLVGSDKQRMLLGLMEEVEGFGPLETLFRDPEVCDILVNHPYEVYVERRGVLEKTSVIFADSRHLLRIIQRMAARVGRRVDESHPMVDARLPDGSRLNATIPPLAVDGPTLSIRRFPQEPLTLNDLLGNGTLNDEMGQFLRLCVQARRSCLISGGTGAGKTTLLNALTAAIPETERIITVEDSVELRPLHPHVVRLESRLANTEGRGALTHRDLVRNALRMRPDRLIVGEVRGPEAVDMLQAMNTGHEGSLSTIHANDTRDAVARLEVMVAMGGMEISVPVIRSYIASGIHLIAHVCRLKDGRRKVFRISELVRAIHGEYEIEDIYRWDIARNDFVFTNHVPSCIEQLRQTDCRSVEKLFGNRITIGSGGLKPSSTPSTVPVQTGVNEVHLLV
jgi:pilus assembly protein CpaF